MKPSEALLRSFNGGTADFTCLGKLMTAGIKTMEILPGEEAKIKLTFDWSAERRSGNWEHALPDLSYMQTRTSYPREIEDCGQGRFKFHFCLGDSAWTWTLKPRYKGSKTTFDMATGRCGTSSAHQAS